jgi:hypothetical protein
MAGVFRKARSAIAAAPDRIDQQELQCRDDREPQQQNAGDGEQDVGRRIEQPRPQQSDKACGLHRRSTFGEQFLSDKRPIGHIAHAPRLRLIRQP